MFQSRTSVIAVSIAALLIGIALGSRLRPPPPEPPSPPPAHAADRIAELTRELDRERGLRAALELELSLLRQEIGSGQAAATAATAPAEAAEDGSAATEGRSEAARTPGEKRSRDEWFDAAELTDLGMDERHAEWLRERFESLQMEEIYLRNEATRGNWLNRPRYARELRKLRDDTRVAMGDEDYDAMLYASGRHNRVLLSNVLPDSPAAAAGIRNGDVLLRYGDRAIFDIRDLLAETAGGELGESTPVEVERDGERVRLFVERGPLGARIQAMRRPPSTRP